MTTATLFLEKALNLTERIERSAKALTTCVEEISDLQSRIAVIEANETLAIAAEKGDDGKLKFTNEAVRAAELCRRLSLSSGRKALGETEAILLNSKATLQAAIAKHQAQVSLYKAFLHGGDQASALSKTA